MRSAGSLIHPAAVAKTRAVKKSYGNIAALNQVDLEIRAGEVLALLGPNGAGKTTLVRVLLGMARPDAGSVSVFGADPYLGRVQTSVGAMLQVGRVPETLKVREHVDLFSSYYPNPLPIEETLEIAGTRGDQRIVHTANCPGDRNSACCSPSPSAAIPICFFSTSRRSASTWKLAA